MKRSFYFLFLLVPVIMFSCKKEVSLETGRLPGDSTVTTPTTTGVCDLSKLVEADSASGSGEYAYISSFNTAHKVVNLDIVDSLTNAIDGSFAITYPTGKIQLDAEQYFVVGSDGNVSEFHGYEYPEYRQGEKFVVKYTYNSTGQMTLRTETYDTLPNVVLYQMKFTYSAGNLTSEVFEANTGTTFLRLGDVAYTYDASKTIKKSLYLYGVAPEILSFQSALTAGIKNVNPVTKAVVTNLYQNTVQTTNFLNYVIDANGYVQSFNVAGADIGALGMSAKKRYKLSYNCY